MNGRPYCVYLLSTCEVVDVSASLERAKDRLWELNDNKQHPTADMAITNELTWEDVNYWNY